MKKANHIDAASRFLGTIGCAALLWGMAVVAGAADESFTDEERASIDETLEIFKKTCIQEMAQVRKDLETERPALAKAPLLSSRYCLCVTQGLRQQLRPSMLRGRTEADGEKLVSQVAGVCAMQLLRVSWDDMCTAMLTEMKPRAGAPHLTVYEIRATCECAKKELDSLPPYAGKGSWNKAFAASGDVVRSCLLSKGGDPEKLRALEAPPIKTTPGSFLARSPDDPIVVSPETSPARVMKAFGLEGRYSRNCALMDSTMSWMHYRIPVTGIVTVESWRGGDTPTLLYRYRLVSAHPVADDQLRLFMNQEFPEGTDGRMKVLIKRVGSGFRMMQATVTTYGKATDRIKDGIFTETRGETPLLSLCPEP